MAEQSRRIGCGCLPLIGLFLIGSVLLGAVEDVTDGAIDSGIVFGTLAVFGFLAVIVAAINRRRATERQDREDDGLPSITGLGPLPRSTYTPQPAPPPRSDREVRTGPRELKTQPEDPGSQAFKRRLADAVADLADNVEGMPAPGAGTGRLTSAEMLERAKRRIADFGSNDS